MDSPPQQLQIELLKRISSQLQEIVLLLNELVERDRPVDSPECEHL